MIDDRPTTPQSIDFLDGALPLPDVLFCFMKSCHQALLHPQHDLATRRVLTALLRQRRQRGVFSPQIFSARSLP
jgi:hypothetical protein